MKKIYLITLLFLSHLYSIGQVEIKIGVNGMNDNSEIMLNAMCNCYGKDRVFFMLDSLSYYGYFVCEIDSNGFVVDIPKHRFNKSSFSKNDLVLLKKYLREHNITFSIVYVNDLGDGEDVKKTCRNEIRQWFRHHATTIITVAFPGYLKSPWERFLKDSATSKGLGRLNK